MFNIEKLENTNKQEEEVENTHYPQTQRWPCGVYHCRRPPLFSTGVQGGWLYACYLPFTPPNPPSATVLSSLCPRSLLVWTTSSSLTLGLPVRFGQWGLQQMTGGGGWEWGQGSGFLTPQIRCVLSAPPGNLSALLSPSGSPGLPPPHPFGFGVVTSLS